MTQNEPNMRVAAVIPAAGLSSRMDAFKPLLPFLGRPLIAYGIEALIAAGAAPVVVVTGHNADALEQALRAYPVRCVRNPRYAQGDMFASVCLGLRALSGYDGVFVLPCDLAPLRRETVAKLMDAFVKTGAPVVSPSCLGRRGHPPLLSRDAVEAVCRYRGGGGLRAALRPFAARTLAVETGDPGVLTDLDTPHDVRRAAFRA